MGENGLKLLLGLGAALFGIAMGCEIAPAGGHAVKHAQHLAGQDEHRSTSVTHGWGPWKKKTTVDVNMYTGDISVKTKKTGKSSKKGGKK